MNSITNLTPQQLRHAADLQEQIFTLQQELNQMLESGPAADIEQAGRSRTLSPQGLANIRAGVRKRWAKPSANGAEEKPAKRRRKMSAAGRASIAARMKARWRAAKRAGRNAL